MIVDAWIQHPTAGSSARRCSPRCGAGPAGRSPTPSRRSPRPSRRSTPPGSTSRCSRAWHGPQGDALISNEEVAGWAAAHPGRFAGVAGVPLDRPMQAVRELRRCVTELGFVGLRAIPWLWEALRPTVATTRCTPTCVELGVPFCTQVGHTGPLRPSETGRPIPYIDQVAIDFPELDDRLRPRRLPLDGGDGGGRPQARERVHRHFRLHARAAAPPSSSITCARAREAARSCSASNWPMIAPAHALAGPRAASSSTRRRPSSSSEANAVRVFALPDGAGASSGAAARAGITG